MRQSWRVILNILTHVISYTLKRMVNAITLLILTQELVPFQRLNILHVTLMSGISRTWWLNQQREDNTKNVQEIDIENILIRLFTLEHAPNYSTHIYTCSYEHTSIRVVFAWVIQFKVQGACSWHRRKYSTHIYFLHQSERCLQAPLWCGDVTKKSLFGQTMFLDKLLSDCKAYRTLFLTISSEMIILHTENLSYEHF